jgi:hypothetical protein
MAELKTKPNDASVTSFLAEITDEQKRKDSFAILELMKKATASKPRMWGDSIVGFGKMHLKYASGRELDWFKIGFSPRKQNLTLYSMGGFDGYEELLGRLGKHKVGKGCLYINKLADVDLSVLKELLRKSAKRG